MDLSMLFKRAGKVAAEKSPAILTAIGVTGTVTTAYLAAKAAYKSVEVLNEAQAAKDAEFLGDALKDVEEGPEPEGVTFVNPERLTTQEQIEAVWKLYVPAFASAAITVAAIICACHINERRNAALASAYTFAEKSYNEYRQKNVEKLGKKKEKELRDELAQTRLDQNPSRPGAVIIAKEGGSLCYDSYSGRYFTCDMESIRKAVNDINALVINDGYASLTDFYEELGLCKTSVSDELGWNTDKLLEIDIPAGLSKQSEPCLIIDYRTEPKPNHYRSSY